MGYYSVNFAEDQRKKSMQIKDLKKNELNPRKISKEEKAKLVKSLNKFGDLSGIIYNVRTKRLAGGHQRSSVLKPTDKIKIETKYEKPSRSGTVAEGYVVSDGERFSYREVDWDKATETEAMIAANKLGGTWDRDVLAVAVQEINNIEYTGFTEDEFSEMNISLPTIDVSLDIPAESNAIETGGDKSTEQIPTMNPNENVKVDFDDVEEKEGKAVSNKRFVIIVDCDSQEHKDSLREKLKPLIEEAKAKIF